ncbi:hypothetical protein HW450_05070 [Corynebacterium hindlerae]|uniref:Uncharacterized protein n=1 Tax=Corynebacterium hindlerae TaxID=699041 RepID=A0A7G5FHJ8_9CORY|nr:hypothetical protein [Corynebacterium hindlerae]QMV86089.1 hypothetical protein HW450_05070 [Corynebacterium hindlerae]
MFDLKVDVLASTNVLRSLIDATETEITRHRAITPGFSALAAGRDFAGHGAALNQVYSALHRRNLELMQQTVAVTDAARRDVTTVGEADTHNEAALDAVAQQGLTWAK